MRPYTIISVFATFLSYSLLRQSVQFSLYCFASSKTAATKVSGCFNFSKFIDPQVKSFCPITEMKEEKMAMARAVLLCLLLVALLELPTSVESASWSVKQTAYTKRGCPTGWNLYALDDTCHRVFPMRNDRKRNVTGVGDGVRMSFWDAQDFCQRQQGWLPLIRNNTAQLRFLSKLVRFAATPGFTWWIGVTADRRQKNTGVSQTMNWMTPAGRTTGFLFRWDGSQRMPSYESCVVMSMKGDANNPGGNDKMITVDCNEVHGVVCTRPRVVPIITSVDSGLPRRIEVIWGQPKTVYFAGAFIPKGTQVTMQTTDWSFANTPGIRTNCSIIRNIAGASMPRTLNVTGRTFNGSKLCGGETCQEARITFPGNWPWVRGATYSFCFFIPIPFTAPVALQEYSNQLMPAAYIEVVQRRAEYFQDICDRRKANLNLFYGDRRLDTNRDKVNPWYFDSTVEGGSPP
jgi:hypothetical protein